ncbi:S8 family serine peptidase [Microtetraspora niveoalba]|uniref:S8 family serine peptidase n=1 Tax=Microtetraspora niveoalba TaxID=46175 RepID=UPI00082A7567|nr:S8 family serine peptidase [Microtetraspora niveoalba]
MLRRAALCAAAFALASPPAAPGHAAPLSLPAVSAPGGEHAVLDAVNAEKAWKVTRGDGVLVAVLDGRVDDTASELKGRVEQGPDMTGTVFGRATSPPGEATSAASLIAGDGSGGGTWGVAPRARVMSIPVISETPAAGFVDPQAEPGAAIDSPLARAIRHAANNRASVINIPSGSYTVGRMDRDAISYALSRGVVIVSGVGDGGDHWRFPAGYPGVVGVAAAGKGTPSGANLSVLVAAPGVDLPVALPGGGHGRRTGSGPASAVVAGVAALIKARYPDLKPELVARALTSSSRREGAGYDKKTGFGVVDAAAALARAGELGGYERAVPVEEDLHFGDGRLAPAPERPGPDPVRLWIYGIGVFLGVCAFTAAVAALTRR